MLLPLVLFALSVAFTAVFLHPYVTYPLSLRLMRSTTSAITDQSEVSDLSRFSLLFCAYNEASVMPAKIANLRDLQRRWPGLEVLAYDDGSTDGTVDLLRAAGDVVAVVQGEGRQGKAAGMKVLAARARGEFLVFTDANVVVSADAVAALSECYRDEHVGGVCGRLVYRASGGSATEATGGAYWRLEERIKQEESRTGNVMGADGSIFSVRASLYPDFPDTVQDDFTVSMSVIFAGYRLIRSDAVIAYEDLVSEHREEFRRKIRIASRAYHTHRHLTAGRKQSFTARDTYKYVSHKILRWFGAYWLVLAGLALSAAILLVYGAVVSMVLLAIVAALVTVLRLVRPHLFLIGWELISAVVATGIGVWRASRGATYATWQPPTR